MGSVKQPYCFEVGEGELFALAGLWDQWQSPEGQTVESCTILTTTPNSLVEDSRMRNRPAASGDSEGLRLFKSGR